MVSIDHTLHNYTHTWHQTFVQLSASTFLAPNFHNFSAVVQKFALNLVLCVSVACLWLMMYLLYICDWLCSIYLLYIILDCVSMIKISIIYCCKCMFIWNKMSVSVWNLSSSLHANLILEIVCFSSIWCQKWDSSNALTKKSKQNRIVG